MHIKNTVLLITGANRGIGKALTEAALAQGAAKIYAAARDIHTLPNFNDPRVVPLKLDITQPTEVEAATHIAQDTQLLINNAGILASTDLLEDTLDNIMQDIEVNYLGTLRVCRAFVPVLSKHPSSAIASISSVVGLASMASIGGYCASKAALFSAIQAMRAKLKAKKIAVFGIYPGPIDTDMTRGMPFKKASAADTALNILKGIESGEEDIFPDPMSREVGLLWKKDPKALERQFSAY